MITSNNATTNFISKRSKIDEMETKQPETQNIAEQEPEPPIDPNAPTVKVCLRLPNGSKETITIVATDTIQVYSSLEILILC